MQLAAFPLRNQRDLRETWPFTCKGRVRNEQACSLTALLYKHELHCLHYVATVFSLRNNAACCIPLRPLRDLREKRPFTCKERAREEQGMKAYPLTALLYKHELHCLHCVVAVFYLRNNAACCIPSA